MSLPPELFPIAALYKHWCTADSVKQFIATPVPVKGFKGRIRGWLHAGQMQSSFYRLSVWYALLYVVIEGYLELNGDDEEVDKLLANEEMVSLLRRFRNATFHYQENPLSDKLIDFLLAEDSHEWPRHVNAALEQYFMRKLPIQEMVQRMKAKA
jgi:hypothetical protein